MEFLRRLFGLRRVQRAIRRCVRSGLGAGCWLRGLRV